MLGCAEKTGTFAAAFILAITLAGCGAASSMESSHIDCNVVKLQSEAGRSPGEIASALGVSEADVQSCHAPGPEAVEQGGGGAGGPPPGKASEYGLPEGMEGAAGGGGGGQGGGGGGQSGQSQ